MSRHAKAHIDDVERRLNEPASPEEMKRRRELAAELQALWNRPMTEEEDRFWQELDADLQRERLTFR
jgi:hypothetical protein